jgi:hypothetical protein
MLVRTSGYFLDLTYAGYDRYQFPNELVYEHRFFGPSRPTR